MAGLVEGRRRAAGVLMGVTLDLTDAAIFTGLRSFLLAVLPPGTEALRAQVNRVAEPACPNFVLMTAVRRARLATNRAEYTDCAFTGSIAGTTLTVTDVEFGVLRIGAPIYGEDVADGTTVTAAGTVLDTYTVTPAQTVASGPLFSGQGLVAQSTQVTVQLDVHGPASADNAQRIATLFRDDYAVRFFEAAGGALAPLYASDPAQMPFENGERQIEYRWVLTAELQAQPVAAHPQQFAAEVDLDLINVE
ncbi:MAG: hypothetical protein K2X46_06175 [Roseomonas sp.]|nr:hypothetical protein [Roseomonas sp.]